MPIKLFISHSSKTVDNQVNLKKVCDNLKGAGYAVLVDHYIPGGDEWRQRLFEWMAECDAAVILMSVDAFDSVWVQAESTILTWRRYIDNNFQLICVLMDDAVKTTDLSDDPLFSVTRPGEFNLIRYENLDEQLKKITASLGVPDNESNTPFNDLVKRMSDILANLGPNADQTLQRAWNHLNCIDKPLWIPGMDFSDALTRLLVREPENALVNLYNLLFEIKQLVDNPKASTLLDIVRGLWVRPEAASLLMLARHKKMSAAINCSRGEFTGKSYARRAWGYPHQCDIILVDDHESFKLDLDEAISKLCFPEEDQQTALLRLKSKRTRKIILLVFIYKAETELSQLQDLSHSITHRFQTITVVFATGQELPEDLPDGVMRILPPLLPDEEQSSYIQYADIDDFIHQ